MTDSAKATLELIIDRIEGEYSNFSVSSRWGRRQLMLGRKMFATFSEVDMSFKLDEDQLSSALLLDGAKPWNSKGRKSPNRGWVQIPISQQQHWMSLALEAANYVNKHGA